MVKTYAKTPKPTENVRIDSNHCMTGEEVRQILFDKQTAAEAEKKRIESNKLERAQKKKDKENAAAEKIAQKEADLIASQQPGFVKQKRVYKKRKLNVSNEAVITSSAISEEFNKVCSNIKCSVMFSEASEQHRILWRSCEECDDWYCGDCFQLFLNDSFVCKKCS